MNSFARTFVSPSIPLLAAALMGCHASPGASAAQAAQSATDQNARIMQRLSILSADSMEGRRAGSAGGARARAWIIRELTAMKAPPEGGSYEHRVRLGSRAGADSIGANIVARIPGRAGAKGPALVLSAHYDHLGIRQDKIYNGADDDASGCIALLTIAERLLREPPQHDVILAFFDGEEIGEVGSKAFVAEQTVPLTQIAMDLSLDMVSRQDGKALWVAGLAHYPGLRDVAEQAVKSASIPIKFGHDTKGAKPGDDWTGSSDHAAFHARGIPFLYLGVEDHVDYHQPGDDADKVDPTFYRGAIDYAYTLLRLLDQQLEQIRTTRGK